MLRVFRKKVGKTRDALAAELGWPVELLFSAEQGTVSLSEGQQNDVRRVMKAGIQSATIRDRLRVKRKPLIRPGLVKP